jgi:hypothetical protein
MKIAKGIEGIRKIKATNASGWHIFTEVKYMIFLEESLSEILAMDIFDGWEIIGFTGNGMTIRPII